MHEDPFDDMPPELLDVLERARVRYGETAAPAAGQLLSSFLSVGLTNDNGDLSATAASNANEPAATQVVGLPNWRTTFTQRRRQAMRTIAALVGTTIGKIVLGATVAAASVGAGQASGVIDVTGDPAPPPQATVDDDLDAPDDDDTEVDEIDHDDVDGDDADDIDHPEGVDDEADDDADEVDDDADEVDDDADEADDDDADDDADEADDDEGDDDGDEGHDDDADEVDDDADEADDDDADDDDDDEGDDDADEGDDGDEGHDEGDDD